MPVPDAAKLLSRELAFSCDDQGRVVWADERAQRLGVKTGALFQELAPPGMEQKIVELVAQARRGSVDRWEVSLVTEGKPRTLAFNAAPAEGNLYFVGSLIPDDYGSSLSQLNEALRELGETHRQLLTKQSELRDTTRGVQVLHQEVEEKEESLRNSESGRIRLASQFSHELRTPVNAIHGLARLLSSEEDGPLSEEQKKQIEMIARASDALGTLINDVMELARAQSGQVPLRLSKFEVADVWAGLRGLMRGMQINDGVQLNFDEPAKDLPQLETDEGKISQVLRNFIANALRFTVTGEVRVTAVATDYGAVRFEVRDTGVGISKEDMPKLFRDFAQLDNELQRKRTGTGLGLAISARMARLLAGDVGARSEPGKGSMFWLTVPAVHPDAAELRLMDARSKHPGERLPQVLVLENDAATLILYERYLARSGYQIVPARTVNEARQKIAEQTPVAVVLDVMLENESTWSFLTELKRTPSTAAIPVAVVTVMSAEDKARALGADEFALKPVDEAWLGQRLSALLQKRDRAKVLIVDDDDATRYLVRRYLENTPYLLLEAKSAQSGIEIAAAEQPDLVLLDFFLPDRTALDVVDALKIDPRTRDIPVIVVTAQPLGDYAQRLQKETVYKSQLSREVALARIRDALAARKKAQP